VLPPGIKGNTDLSPKALIHIHCMSSLTQRTRHDDIILFGLAHHQERYYDYVMMLVSSFSCRLFVIVMQFPVLSSVGLCGNGPLVVLQVNYRIIITLGCPCVCLILIQLLQLLLLHDLGPCLM